MNKDYLASYKKDLLSKIANKNDFLIREIKDNNYTVISLKHNSNNLFFIEFCSLTLKNLITELTVRNGGLYKNLRIIKKLKFQDEKHCSYIVELVTLSNLSTIYNTIEQKLKKIFEARYYKSTGGFSNPSLGFKYSEFSPYGKTPVKTSFTFLGGNLYNISFSLEK